MKVITKQMMASNAAKQWHETYLSRPRPNQSSHRATYKALVALGDSPSPEEVDKVIGNNSWTNLECYECGKERLDTVVEVGSDSSDYEGIVRLCRDCVHKIYEAI